MLWPFHTVPFVSLLTHQMSAELSQEKSLKQGMSGGTFCADIAKLCVRRS
jgi:hypothetical protein